jgi:hypothetical protein
MRLCVGLGKRFSSTTLQRMILPRWSALWRGHPEEIEQELECSGTPKGKNEFHRRYVEALADDRWFICMYKASETGLLSGSKVAQFPPRLSSGSRCSPGRAFHFPVTSFDQPPFAFASDARKTLFRELVAVHLTKETGILVRRLADQVTDIVVCWRVLYWA